MPHFETPKFHFFSLFLLFFSQKKYRFWGLYWKKIKKIIKKNTKNSQKSPKIGFLIVKIKKVKKSEKNEKSGFLSCFFKEKLKKK